MLLYLKIKPNQRFNRVEKTGNDWIVRVKAPATEGKANEQLVDFLSELFNISKSKIQIKKGTTSRLKCIDVDADEKHILDCLATAANLHKMM